MRKKSNAGRETDVPKRDKLGRRLEGVSFSFFFWSRIGYAPMLRRKDRREGWRYVKDAAGSSGKRRQMGGGDSTKVEAAKRRRQD